MHVTINTDASYSHKYKIGAFAFWITCDGGTRFFNAGPLNGQVDSPSVAELMCIVKALVYLQQLQVAGTIPAITHVHVNTDSLNSIHIFRGEQDKVLRYGLNKGQYKSVFGHWLRVKKFPNWTFKFKHVKSHESTQTARQYVNDWCDKNAKKFIQILITEKENA